MTVIDSGGRLFLLFVACFAKLELISCIVFVCWLLYLALANHKDARLYLYLSR